MTVRIIQGDALQVLKTLPDESVNCFVTSPPYWGQRDYGVEGQLGLERTPEEYVSRMVEVFCEGRRVLRDDGTIWLNLGDSYSCSRGGKQGISGQMADRSITSCRVRNHTCDAGLKFKDLVGIPWLVAFALRADGWYLRKDIIWEKPNCMPESCKDRPTTSHEYIFLLSKSATYFYAAEAVKVPCSPDTHPRYARSRSSDHKYADGGPRAQTITKSLDHMLGAGVNRKAKMAVPTSWETGNGSHCSLRGRIKQNPSFAAAVKDLVEKRNLRSVWRIPTKGFSGAHFATFPPKLVEPCILAGCTVGGTVLDPFGGSGTVGMVAEQHGRNSILIELNPEYCEMAKRRTAQSGLFCASLPAEVAG